MSLARIPGARFAFVVVPLEGTVERLVYDFVPMKKEDGSKRAKGEPSGLTAKMKSQPAGFMVYFPRGFAIRMRDEDHLKQYNLHKAPRIINMSGLTDPNSPVGKIMMAQNEQQRTDAYADLEKMVIRLATAKSGNVLMPEQLVEEGEEVHA